MTSSVQTGRWVIVLGDNSAPVFWSRERKTLEDVCDHVRRSHPIARVVWEELPGDGRAFDSREEEKRQ